MKVVYYCIAEDGTIFGDEWDCEDYEWKLAHKEALDKVEFYDKNGTKLCDWISNDTYNSVQKIIVSDKESIQALHELAQYTGYCLYEEITETGTWVFVENKPFAGDSHFYKGDTEEEQAKYEEMAMWNMGA